VKEPTLGRGLIMVFLSVQLITGDKNNINNNTNNNKNNTNNTEAEDREKQA